MAVSSLLAFSLLVSVSLFSLPHAQACALNGNCQSCQALKSLPQEVLPTDGPTVTFANGSKITIKPSLLTCYFGTCDTSSASGLNYEIFQELYPSDVKPLKVYLSPETTLAGCCLACKGNAKCAYYHYLPISSLPFYFQSSPAYVPGTRCYLINVATVQQTPTDYQGAPRAFTHSTQLSLKNSNAPSYVGGICSGQAQGEPHFQGGHGTDFDFNGRIDKSYCIVSDRNVAINALLSGYAISGKEWKGLRAGVVTWMKELGFVWKAPDANHTIHMVARTGSKDETRGNGFLASLAVDGQQVALPEVGVQRLLPGGAVLTLVRVGKEGPYETEYFHLALGSHLAIDISLRAEQKPLQLPTDSEVHFNIKLNYLNLGEDVHGVLGQTLQNTKERVLRHLRYSHLNGLLHQNVHVDTPEGMGFLDGQPDDYITSGVLDTNCKYSKF